MSGNQYKPDPRQSLFLKHYLDPKSETFSNAYQSAIKAGYEEEYAQNLTGQMPKWLSESIRTEQMLNKAEKNLDILMESEDERVKADVSKFVAGRLGKRRWSEKTEVEHSGEIKHSLTDEQAIKIIQRRTGSPTSPIQE